jgi:cobalt-zinc-cadmium efflux system membrane fusion protein
MRNASIRWTAIALLLLAGCRGEQRDKHTDHKDHHDEHQEPNEAGQAIRLSPSAVERSGIRAESVTRERLVGGIDVLAEVQLNPDRTAHISPMVPGQIEEVRVALGDHVKAGEMLATMRSVALGEARSSVANARAAVAVARANFRRQEQLQREGIGSQRAYLEAQGALRSAEADLAAAGDRLHVYGGRKGSGSTTTIRSPLDGTVIERHASPGEVVSGESELFVIANLSRVWVVGRVYEQDVSAARVGAPAVVSLQAYPGRTWEGEVDYVASTLDADTRTLPIRVELDNSEGILRPGLFGRISLSPPGDEEKSVV